MKTRKLSLVAMTFAVAASWAVALADNPLIMDQYTADPTGRLFNGKIYMYPSHDMPEARAARNGSGWFAMQDYHVFSTDDLINWKDHGVILDQKQVPWVSGAADAMWAPDCVERDGKYYFYFPASNQIGVAVGDKPEGPFTLNPTPIVRGIDPCCFIDWSKYKKDVAAAKDEAAKKVIVPDAYLVWKGNPLSIHKLSNDMASLDPEAKTINVAPGNVPGTVVGAPAAAPPAAPAAPASAPASQPGAGRAGRGAGGGGGNANGLIEGPFMFERKGIYYLTYPHAIRNAGFESEALEYAISDSPTGPFKVTGTIMDQTANHCWTNHHSLVEYQGQWILFYHDKDLSPSFDKDRSIRADYLTFNEDGTINKVIPTFRGVGTANARNKVQIDRYSEIGKDGVAVAFVDDKDTFKGWKTNFTDKGGWIRYNRVDFGKDGLKLVKVQSMSPTGGAIEIRLDKANGPVLAKVDVSKGDSWKEGTAKLNSVATGTHDIFVSMPEKNDVAVDWVSFE